MHSGKLILTSMKNSKIAIFISKFDPPTIGDMSICSELLCRTSNYDQFWFAPIFQHHPDHSYEMTKLAVHHTFPETLSIKIVKLNYGQETLVKIQEGLQKEFPMCVFKFILKECEGLYSTLIEGVDITLVKVSCDNPTNESTMAIFNMMDEAMLDELKKRLNMIKRDSTLDVCKVISMIPKMVLQYIIINNLYLN